MNMRGEEGEAGGSVGHEVKADHFSQTTDALRNVHEHNETVILY